LSSKILEFPASFEQRLQSALDDQARGNCSGALKKFIAMIDDGCPAAYAFVGLFYEIGCPGVEKDYEKARFYYERAIEQHGSAEAYLGLGRIYYFGRGVDPDYCKAFKYYDLVAREAKNNGVACLMLGQMYQLGQCIEKDFQKAKECYQKAWQRGYVFGLTYLGKLEQQMGHPVKGWLHRLKAGFMGYTIARKDPHDSRLRSR
jgi:TPR repeat protein